MEISILAVILSAVASMVIGFAWYSNVLFSKPWMKETGVSMSNEGKGAGMGYLLTTVGSIVMAVVLSVFMNLTKTEGLVNGLFIGFLAWLGFVAPSYMATYIFSGKSLKLYLIDCGYFLASFLAAGAIIGSL